MSVFGDSEHPRSCLDLTFFRRCLLPIILEHVLWIRYLVDKSLTEPARVHQLFNTRGFDLFTILSNRTNESTIRLTLSRINGNIIFSSGP